MPATVFYPGGVTSTTARVRLDTTELANPGEPPMPVRPAAIVVEPTPAALRIATRTLAPRHSHVLDLTGLDPDTRYTVRHAGLDSRAARFRTAPAAVTADRPLLLGLSSCYFPSDRFVANPRAVKSCWVRRAGIRFQETGGTGEVRTVPHAKFLCGDQIYGDVPASTSRDIDAVYRGRYRDAWSDVRLGPVLGHGGNFFASDDHEFWNDFPESVLWLRRSHGERWTESARAALHELWLNQGIWNFPPGFQGGESRERSWTMGRLADIDVFVADTRSERSSKDGSRRPGNGAAGTASGAASLLSADQLAAIERWLAGIGRAGILVTSQPIALHGSGTDAALSDFPEFDTILRAVWDTVDRRGKPVLVLSGDIHWGRLMSWTSPRTGARLVEFVSSPIARVGLQSIFTTRWDVGKPKDVRRMPEPEHLDVIHRVTDRRPERYFATGRNNIGMAELTVDDQGRLAASFELWGLGTGSRARNFWGGPERCVATVGLGG